MMTLVLIAEAATVAFFVIFGRLVATMVRDGRNLPSPRSDAIGDAFVGPVRLAMMLGYAAFFALTGYRALSGGHHGP